MDKKRYVTLMFRICFSENDDICTASSPTPEIEWDEEHWSGRW